MENKYQGDYFSYRWYVIEGERHTQSSAMHHLVNVVGMTKSEAGSYLSRLRKAFFDRLHKYEAQQQPEKI